MTIPAMDLPPEGAPLAPEMGGMWPPAVEPRTELAIAAVLRLVGLTSLDLHPARRLMGWVFLGTDGSLHGRPPAYSHRASVVAYRSGDVPSPPAVAFYRRDEDMPTGQTRERIHVPRRRDQEALGRAAYDLPTRRPTALGTLERYLRTVINDQEAWNDVIATLAPLAEAEAEALGPPEPSRLPFVRTVGRDLRVVANRDPFPSVRVEASKGQHVSVAADELAGLIAALQASQVALATSN